MSDRMPRKPVAVAQSAIARSAVDTATATKIEKAVSDNAKASASLLKKVDSALNARNKANDVLHDVACAVLSHFAQHRNNAIINHLYRGLKKNDADAFRMWCVRHSRKENEDGTFSVFFRFTVKDGFVVVKGQTSDHVQPYEVLLVGDTMFDIDQEKEIKEANADKLLATLAGLSARVNKALEKMDEGERARFPHNILEETARLSRIASETKIPKPVATTH